jgi:TPR repeat protein
MNIGGMPMRRSFSHAFCVVALTAGFVGIQPCYAEDPPDSLAQFRTGYLYERGNGVVQDYKEAMRLYLLSAAQGNDVAEFRIGYLYEKGLGVVPDDAQAMQWYEKAAARGNQPAASRLAVLKVKHGQSR